MIVSFTIFTVLSVWSSIFLALVDAGSIAAWTTGQGAPQVMVQDDDTGKILYSLCNSNETAVFPANESRSLMFDDNLWPKKGTNLAGIGYVNQDGITVAAMWYLNDENAIVHALWQCNETGHLTKANPTDTNQWIISTDIGSIHEDTGLAAVNLGSTNGYRVYYQQEDLTTSTMKYVPNEIWTWNGNVSQDSSKGFPIHAGFTDTDKITVVTPRDKGNIEVSTMQPNETWVIYVDRQEDKTKANLAPTNATNSSSFALVDNAPHVNAPLEAWDGNAKGIGFALDSDATRRIFYIGSDSKLHCQSDKEKNVWSACSDIDASKWPTADSPNAPFATTSDFSRNEIWIFYMSGGNLTQVHRSSKDKWEAPIALPKTPPPPPPPAMEAKHGGLSKGAQAGIGVGVSVVGLALIGLAAYIYLQRKRGKQEKEKAEADAEAVASANQPPDSYPSPAPGVPEGQWVDGKWAPTPEPNKKSGPWQDRSSYQQVPNSPPVSDMTNLDQICEMPHEVTYHEMPVEANPGGAGK
ncbi:hypothetical protein HD806DRAFT_545474 [Xylariaceae sp. AK1471]|nr:hypothetical protein HD806DRAFT_545474 [Xylariaceae sp. AK1471]